MRYVIIETMFEEATPIQLIEAIENTCRAESKLMARKLAAIAELLAHRMEEEYEAECGPGYATVSGFQRTIAEVAAAMNLSPRAASFLVSHAEALKLQLPKIGALLAEGRTDWRTVELIIIRTEFVGGEVISQLDESLAARIVNWHCWSRRRIISAVDAAVRALDPDAARERRLAAEERDRHINVAPLPDGLASVRGTIAATAAAAFDKRLSEMATSLCAEDPRTIAQRRADALAALAEGRALTCICKRPDCRTDEQEPEKRTGPRVVINVVASEETVRGRSEQPGYLQGYGVIDADQVRQLADAAAQRMLDPSFDAAAAFRYQPTVAMEQWIRCRDLTCRFPGCDRPAEFCDVDHTIPFNHDNPTSGGLTVPWNLKCLCRQHHRLKTFYCGPGGWQDEQLADGTIVWTSPTGKVYRTTPAGVDLFSQLRSAPCAEPKRRSRNHSKARAARITRARRRSRTIRPINDEHRRVRQARKHEIEARKFRNHVRDMLFLFKGKPSTSPFCIWVNDPYEPEELPPDWQPPPKPPPVPDDPPF